MNESMVSQQILSTVMTCIDLFYTTILKITKEIFVKEDLLTTENTESVLKVHAPHYANELLVHVSFPFKNFYKLAQHAEAIRKHCLVKE